MKNTKNSEINSDHCPGCGTGQLKLKSGTYETVFHDGENEKVLKIPEMSWLECEKCGEVILDDKAMRHIDKAKYNALGLLTPEEIRTIRERLQRTQEQMATLLGVGQKTYCRWENGTFFQIRVNDRYLRWITRLLDECPEAIEILKELAGEIPNKSQKLTSIRTATSISVAYESEHVIKSAVQFDPNLSGHEIFRKREYCCAGKA